MKTGRSQAPFEGGFCKARRELLNHRYLIAVIANEELPLVTQSLLIASDMSKTHGARRKPILLGGKKREGKKRGEYVKHAEKWKIGKWGIQTKEATHNRERDPKARNKRPENRSKKPAKSTLTSSFTAFLFEAEQASHDQPDQKATRAGRRS